jgi:predicted methyltransferase
MLTIVLPLSALAASPSYAQDYTSLLAAPDRTDADRQNDKKREAEKLLTFIGPKPGWRVLDMAAGAGYSTELMARAVTPVGRSMTE